MNGRDGRTEPTPVGDEGDARALRGDSRAREQGGRGTLLPGPVHAVGARGDGAPLGGGAPAGAGAAVPGDSGTDRRLDDDGDARGALASARGGRLPGSPRPRRLLSARPEGAARKLRVAVPAKGRLREPSFHLFE